MMIGKLHRSARWDWAFMTMWGRGDKGVQKYSPAKALMNVLFPALRLPTTATFITGSGGSEPS